MFFVLSKVLNFLTNPLIFVFGFLAAAAQMKKDHLKKRFFWISFFLLLFFSNDFIANEAMLAWEVKATPYASINNVYDWGIVLTGVTANDREPADRVYFNHGADRVTHTVQLYKKGIIKKILVTGGSGRLLA
ncbi:MAG TPA: YdcF family protein, partial [Cyclobacteriaceae bacterium]|nr:YdcF family protein [Cyclobacteriaceae bacterium]